jgi:putative photosynthetic complex assembly protein
MSAVDSQPFPRPALIGAGLLIGATILATAAARMTGYTIAPTPLTGSTPVASVDLAFADDADGSVIVKDVTTGRVITVLKPNTNGFIRGVVRGLAHDRLTHGIGSAPPFRLIEQARGQMFLKDTATGRVIDLQAFGAGNRDGFKLLLHPGGVAS